MCEKILFYKTETLPGVHTHRRRTADAQGGISHDPIPRQQPSAGVQVHQVTQPIGSLRRRKVPHVGQDEVQGRVREPCQDGLHGTVHQQTDKEEVRDRARQ